MSENASRRSDAELARLRRQSAALAEFGEHAVSTQDLDALLHEACQLVSEATSVELVKVLQLLPDGETMLVRAGVNWKPGVVGHATFGAHEGSPSGYALEKGEAVISADTAREDRFEIPQLMLDHGVRSMVNVLIRGERPWGVLEIDSHQPRGFDADDIAFLKNYANLLAAAIDRLKHEAELKQTAEHTALLLGELRHRMRNTIMSTIALAKRLAKECPNDLQAFLSAFEARLRALGRTHDLLARGLMENVTLRQTLVQELFAHGEEAGERVRISGPEVALKPKGAQALAMGFHELATNAVKHGALARTGAKLEVTWQVTGAPEAPELVIRWRELGVAIAAAPERRGFGSETIEKSLPHMLGGEAALTFHPDGLECRIRLPASPDWSLEE